MKKVLTILLLLVSFNTIAKGGGGHGGGHSSGGHSSSHSSSHTSSSHYSGGHFSGGYSHGSVVRSSGSIYHPYLYHTTLIPHPYVAGTSDGTDEQPDNIPNAENESSWDNILLTILVAVIVLLVIIFFISILMV